MIQSEILRNYFKPYSYSEQTYMKYHMIKMNPQTFKAEFALLKENIEKDGNNWEDFWFPEVNLNQNPDVVQGLYYPFDDDIVIAKHMRYHPLFSHAHDFYEMIYVFEGRCHNHIDGIDLVMEEGSICIIPPDISHSIGIFDESVIANILIKKTTLNSMFSRFLMGKSDLALFFTKTIHGGKAYRYAFFPEGSDRINSMIENLILEAFVHDEYSSDMKKVRLLECFYHLIREHSHQGDFSQTSGPHSEVIQQLMKYMNSHLQSVSLSAVAEYFNYSVPYLSRLVKQCAGKSFSDLLRDAKISKACELLSKSEKSIREISDILGYEDPIYFSRVFRSQVGIPPTEYRKNNFLTVRHVLADVRS